MSRLENELYSGLILGLPSVGKTTLLHYFFNRLPAKNIAPSIGITKKTLNEISFFDLSGNERFAMMRKSFMKKKDFLLIILDDTNTEKSLTMLEVYFKEINELYTDNFYPFVMILINKKNPTSNTDVIHQIISKTYFSLAHYISEFSFQNEHYCKIILQKILSRLQTKEPEKTVSTSIPPSQTKLISYITNIRNITSIPGVASIAGLFRLPNSDTLKKIVDSQKETSLTSH